MGTESADSRGAAEVPAEPDLEPRRTVDALEQRINEEKAEQDRDQDAEDPGDDAE